MEKDFGSWFLHQQFDRLSPNWNTLGCPFSIGQQNTIPAYRNHCPNVKSTNGPFQGFQISAVPHSMGNQPNESHDWFYSRPHFPQAFTPGPNPIFKDKIPDGPGENQKKFLVFDQSRGQTTMIFSLGFGTPVQCLTSCGPKLDSCCDLNKTKQGTSRDTVHYLDPISTDESNENHKDEWGSEMHEDTEEINALLYSDDEDDYYEDDEEASTGHSPSTMTAYDKQEPFEESVEEVASSGEPTKRMKMSNGGYAVPSLRDNARYSDYEDDAVSSCADGKNQGLVNQVSLSGNKRSKKDKIRETVSVLQSIIPAGKGKDAIGVIDEAINYLRSLKQKAKALGVDKL